MKRFGIIGIAVLFAVFAFTAAARAQDHDKDAAPDSHHEDAKPEKKQPDHDKATKPEHHDQDKQNDNQNKGDADRQDQHKDHEKAAQQQEHDQQKKEDDERNKDEKAEKHDQQKNNDQRKDDRRANDQHANDQRQMQQSQPERRVSANDQRNVWQEHRAKSWQSEHRTWQQRGGYHGYHIPDDRFRASFGEAHLFTIVSLPVVVVAGAPRFEAAGFWFAVVDPWPEYWSDNWYQTDECYVEYFDGGYYLTDVRYPQVRLAINVFVQ
jgi:hypothetical protein